MAFDCLAELGVGGPGLRALDLGSGTGQMARGLARSGARVWALDPARDLLVAGREGEGLDPGLGAPALRLAGRAEALPVVPQALDLVTAAQCWHWFDAPRVLEEVRRVLRPGGRLALVHLDWLPLPQSVVAATEALILEHNPRWSLGGGDGRYPRYDPQLERAGFTERVVFELDLSLAFSHADWRGRIRASAGVGASLAPDAVRRFDEDHRRLLAERFPAEPLAVPHRVFAVVGRRGPAP